MDDIICMIIPLSWGINSVSLVLIVLCGMCKNKLLHLLYLVYTYYILSNYLLHYYVDFFLNVSTLVPI